MKNLFYISVILFLFTFSSAATNITSLKPIDHIDIRVCAGDNLWSISKEYCNNSIDLREYIYNVKKINNLKNSNITVGQILKIPIYEIKEKSDSFFKIESKFLNQLLEKFK
ncbi:LysM peptidoglycan-binding domain-containing protein [Peptostreptococcaceae bacterium AGR-M142]